MKKNIFPLGACLAALLGIVALLIPFAPFVLVNMQALEQQGNIDGFHFIIGDSSNGDSATAWSFVLVGIALAIVALAYDGMSLKKSRIAGLILFLGGVFLLTGAILYFFFIQFSGMADSTTSQLINIAYTYSYGAWIGGIAGILGGAIGILSGAIKILKK